ncbi:MAG: RNA polymerase sigma factor [Lachnospiraceae bacterium]
MENLEYVVERMREGDEEAFDQLFAWYQNKIFRMAYLISGNYADSEDIVQETFVKCYSNRHQLKDVSGFQSWLYQILTRTAWRYCRKSRREQPVETLFDQELESGELLPLDQVLQSEESMVVRREINRLPLKQRTVVIYYYYNDMTTKEIARVTGCMEGTVKSRLFTARKRLEQALKQWTMDEKESLLWKKEKSIS